MCVHGLPLGQGYCESILLAARCFGSSACENGDEALLREEDGFKLPGEDGEEIVEGDNEGDLDEFRHGSAGSGHGGWILPGHAPCIQSSQDMT